MIGDRLFTTTLISSEVLGAIVGEGTLPHAALVFEGTDILTTGEHSTSGQTGDMGGIGEFACEFWLQLRGALPGAARNIARGPEGGGSGQPQWLIRYNTDGTLTAVIRTGVTGATVNTINSTRPLAVDNTATLWDHIVVSWKSNVCVIYVNGINTGQQSFGGDIPFFEASNNGMRIGDGGLGAESFAVDAFAVYRGGLSEERVIAHLLAGGGRGFGSQLTGARINAVLDAVDYDSTRDIDTGVNTVQPVYQIGQAPLDEIRNAISGEALESVFFVARDGTLVFLDSDHRSSSPYNTVQATFDDDGTDLPYHGLTIDYSETFLVNEWTVTRPGWDASTQTATDITSISRYRKRAQGLSPPVTTDGQAATIATAMLAKYKDPMTRVTSITLSTAEPAVSEAVFRRDIGDRIRVFRTAPGGGARIDQTLFIQSIQIDASPGEPWRVTWGVSPV